MFYTPAAELLADEEGSINASSVLSDRYFRRPSDDFHELDVEDQLLAGQRMIAVHGHV